MEEATLTLYRIRQCGFYDAGEEHQFGTLAETMRRLLDWTSTLASIGESSTYGVDEDADILRAFCLDLRDLGNGRYLLATWNELPTVEEGVQILQVKSRIGAADISAVAMDAMSLPGYPAFFCIDTRRQRVVNIRFDQRLNGSRQFQKFVAGFLSSASPWCVWDADDEERLLGYSDDDGDDPEILDGAVARFATSMVRVNADENHIRENVNDIRKIIRRATVDPVVATHKTFLDSAFQLAGLPINNRLRAEINFQYEFKTRLTPEKLEAVIAAHDRGVEDSWDDVGFVFARESQKIHWLSGAVARTKRQLEVERLEGGVIDVEALADYIRADPARVLDAFNEQ